MQDRFATSDQLLVISLSLITQRMFEGMKGFPLLAVPFFVLTGQLMLKGRLLRKMCDFANALVGNVRGGLAMINIVVSLFWGRSLAWQLLMPPPLDRS